MITEVRVVEFFSESWDLLCEEDSLLLSLCVKTVDRVVEFFSESLVKRIPFSSHAVVRVFK